MNASKRIRIAVSSCLLGHEVRYDGGHKHNDLIANKIASLFELVPFCPEMAIGLEVPRPPIQLVKDETGTHAVGVNDQTIDVTENLYACGKQLDIHVKNIAGYIFKARSPSCGITDTLIFSRQGDVLGTGDGMFVRAVLDCLPGLPVIDEGKLENETLREQFIAHVHSYQRN